MTFMIRGISTVMIVSRALAIPRDPPARWVLAIFLSLNPYNRCTPVALTGFSTDDEGRCRAGRVSCASGRGARNKAIADAVERGGKN